MKKNTSQTSNLLCVGSIAYDSIQTPFGKVNKTLGGSASYFALASRFFAKSSLVGVVGNDFKKTDIKILKDNADISGLLVAKGKTFHWAGKYHYDLNTRDTLKTSLGVFAGFKPGLNDKQKQAKYVFLGNIHPKLQLDVLKQIDAPKFVGLDTMNFWIDSALPDLKKVIKQINLLVINDSEARQLSGEHNLVKCAGKILGMMAEYHPLAPSYSKRGNAEEGAPLKTLIIKQGEHGLLMFNQNLSLRVHPKQSNQRLPRPSDALGASKDMDIFNLPGFPLEDVIDPTGAGDSFAGALMGYLAKCDDISETNIKKACAKACVVASFCVQGFGISKLDKIKLPDIEKRLTEYKNLINF